ncbi:hypothetical protein HNP38_002834 [Chryseobacterium defluvii]|uniref:Secretion system C-terminal sorting domain-containing protein n=1 Tax=Chryseobacterium defluvii TaxID=160396 RepID=A0A840KHN1_9FLAO|nr:T9SS type A sorting domain-containing protein [Chryseobacterium defluvii]MBB4807528.1 hypothetical protein [Chryseobacterium defluvii]
MKKSLSFIATVLFVFVAFAQNYKPIRGMGIRARLAQNGQCVAAASSSNINTLIDANINSGVSLGNLINNTGSNGISVSDNNTMYAAGSVAGFNVDMGNGAMTSTVANSLSIATYKNGVLQETSAPGAFSSTPAYGGQKSRTFLHFKTTKAFNEIRLLRSGSNTACNAMNIYYAFTCAPNVKLDNNGVCDDIIGGASADIEANISCSSNLTSPLSVITNRDRISDGDKSSFGTVTLPSGFSGSFSIGVFDKTQYYPAGNRAGFVISPANSNAVLTEKMLNNLVIETYLFGQLQNSQSYNSGSGTMNVSSMNLGGNKQKISIATTKPFNEVRLKISQNSTCSNMGAINIYYAFEEPQNCDCKQYLQCNRTAPYKGALLCGNLPNGASYCGRREPWSGTWSTTTSYLGVYNAEYVVDSNPSTYATFSVPSYKYNLTGNIAVESVGTTYPAGTYAGFTIGKSTSTDWSALGVITVQLYNGNTLVEQKSTTNGLKLITVSGGKTEVGFKSTKAFNRIRISIKHTASLCQCVNYYIYNVFVELDSDGDGVPDCKDICPNGDDNIDSDGDGIPDACDTTSCVSTSDKSSTIDTDGDGIPNGCDGDSDNDGIPDIMEEDVNNNGLFEDDDVDGDLAFVEVLGDGVANYLDLDSDNDGVLDLFESGIPASVIDQIDTDHNGVVDSNIPVGANGIADILETAPDSGVMKYAIKDTDGDGVPDFLDLKSNGSDFDLYQIGRADLDLLGGGFISIISDSDLDGIQAVVDTDLVNRGAPNSPLIPGTPFAKNAKAGAAPKDKETKDAKAVANNGINNEIVIYPNPVKAGENLNVRSAEEGTYAVFSAQGQLVKNGKFNGNTEINTTSMPAGMYIIKIETKSAGKTFKVIVK